MKKIFVLALFLPFSFYSQSLENKIKRDDLLILTGANWEGSLTYKDSLSDKSLSRKATLKVERLSENIFLFRTGFPEDSTQNKNDTIKLSKSGSTINDQTVMRRSLKGDTVVVVSEKGQLKSDSTQSKFRYTYKIHPKSFIISTVEKTDTSANFSLRKRYTYIRE